MVRQIPEKLQLEEFYQWLDQGEGHEEGSSSLRQSAKTTVSRLLESADDDFDNKVRQIVDDISSKTLFMVFGLIRTVEPQYDDHFGTEECLE